MTDQLPPPVSLGGATALPPPSAGDRLDQPGEPRRLQRLSEGVRDLRTRSSLNLSERTLMILAGIVAPTGIVLVLLGWWGAAHTPNLFEQVPYLISGGLLGLGLVFLGSFFYFAHWLTELVKEHRTQSAAVVDAIGRLEDAIARIGTGPSSNGVAPFAPPTSDGAGTAEEVVLVATERGTMAHRPECVVVAGKVGLRGVTPGDGLAACKLCDPYAATVN